MSKNIIAICVVKQHIYRTSHTSCYDSCFAVSGTQQLFLIKPTTILSSCRRCLQKASEYLPFRRNSHLPQYSNNTKVTHFLIVICITGCTQVTPPPVTVYQNDANSTHSKKKSLTTCTHDVPVDNERHFP